MKEKSGLSDIVFCHVSGFIGGARSYDSALQMAALSLEDSDGDAELKTKMFKAE